MAHAARTVRHLARALLGVLVLYGITACDTDGTTASCRTEDGEELPLYNVDDVDDAGLYPDAEVERIRAELIDRNCLTALGHATSPDLDSGSD